MRIGFVVDRKETLLLAEGLMFKCGFPGCDETVAKTDLDEHAEKHDGEPIFLMSTGSLLN